jgi:molecular chaperone GrpE
MINRQYIQGALALFLMGAAVTTVDAFTLSNKASLTTTTTACTPFAPVAFVQTSTCLRASEEGEETQEEPAEEGDETSAGNGGGENSDILSSPAFLKRKVDVLKSDIAAAEAEIEELKIAVEEGKAEWGDQLDQLQTEVGF